MIQMALEDWPCEKMGRGRQWAVLKLSCDQGMMGHEQQRLVWAMQAMKLQLEQVLCLSHETVG